MTNSFNMSNWRRKYVLVAENGNDPKAEIAYSPEIHGKITSFEEATFEPAEAPTEVVFAVATEKDLENAKELKVSFEKFAQWANEEGLDLERDEDADIAAKKYFEQYYSEHLSDEGKKSLRAQMFETGDTEEGKMHNKHMQEDLDLGHEDDEPHMVKAELYRIAKYATELYQMVDKFEGQGEVDFPAWWQAKITTSMNNMVSAKHYLDFEIKEPAIDTMSLYEKFSNNK